MSKNKNPVSETAMDIMLEDSEDIVARMRRRRLVGRSIVLIFCLAAIVALLYLAFIFR